jgi:hypothetical protein
MQHMHPGSITFVAYYSVRVLKIFSGQNVCFTSTLAKALKTKACVALPWLKELIECLPEK